MAGHSVEDARERAYVPAIHVFLTKKHDADALDKRGQDG
jgi:hypothetical protein